MSVIQVENLTKDYGHNRGVFDVSFEVHKGEVFGFLGPNGAGKTTAIRHIMVFSRPQSGKTTVEGLDSWKHHYEIQRNLGYLPGEIALPENLTGAQFIKMMAELRGISDMTYTDNLIKRFELEASGSLKRMSLGMKRKLAVVTAFMHDPMVLVLDEPTSGLDPMIQDMFIQFVREEKERDKTIFLSSHMFKEVDATCDRISIIKDGRLVSTFVADDLRHSASKQWRFEFAVKEDFERFSKQAEGSRHYCVASVKPEHNQMQVLIHDSEINTLIAELSNYPLVYFKEIKVSFEDYFMRFYDHSTHGEGGEENAAH